MSDSTSYSLLSLWLLCGAFGLPLGLGVLVGWRLRGRWEGRGWWALVPDWVKEAIDKL